MARKPHQLPPRNPVRGGKTRCCRSVNNQFAIQVAITLVCMADAGKRPYKPDRYTAVSAPEQDPVCAVIAAADPDCPGRKLAQNPSSPRPIEWE